MAEQITKDRALELLREIVAEYGEDWVYASRDDGTTCTYTRQGQPSCLIGHVLHRAGVPIEHLATLDRGDTPSIGTTTVDWGIEITPDARRVLGVAQHAQDDGSSWGTALAMAEEAAGDER